MPDNTFLVKTEVRNPKVGTHLERMIQSAEGFQAQRPDDTRRPDLLIFELGDSADSAFEIIRSLLKADAVGEVFLTSENADPAVLMQAMRTGVKEFFAQPLKEAEVRRALNEFKGRREKPGPAPPDKMGQIIDIIGSKGGVGATTVAVNLAVSLADEKKGRSVALVDMNMLFGDIPLFLGVKPNHHWGEITKNIHRLDPTFLMNILTKHPSGVHVLPSPTYLNGHPGVTPEIMDRLFGLMQRMFDFVSIDAGQSLTDASLRAVQMSNGVLLVSLLSLTCLSNTNRLLTSLKNLGYLPKDNVRVLINRYMEHADISLRDAEDSIRQKVFWTIPNDYRTTMSAINQGKALPEIASKTAISRNFEGLAQTFTQDEERREKSRWGFLKRRQ